MIYRRKVSSQFSPIFDRPKPFSTYSNQNQFNKTNQLQPFRLKLSEAQHTVLSSKKKFRNFQQSQNYYQLSSQDYFYSQRKTSSNHPIMNVSSCRRIRQISYEDGYEQEYIGRPQKTGLNGRQKNNNRQRQWTFEYTEVNRPDSDLTSSEHVQWIQRMKRRFKHNKEDYKSEGQEKENIVPQCNNQGDIESDGDYDINMNEVELTGIKCSLKNFKTVMYNNNQTNLYQIKQTKQEDESTVTYGYRKR